MFSFVGANFVSAQKLSEAETVETRRTILHVIRAADSISASNEAVKGLRDRAEIVRATAPFSVLALPADEAAAALLPQTADKSEFVRRETAYALGETRSRSAIDALIKLLDKDKKYQVRCAAAVALGKIGDTRTIVAIYRNLRRSRRADEDFLRRALMQSLGEIAQTYVFLQAFGENFGREISDKNVWENILRGKRKNLLEEVSAFAESFDVMQTVINKRDVSNDEKRAAAFAFGQIGDVRTRPTLKIFQKDADYYLAEIAARALQNLAYENIPPNR